MSQQDNHWRINFSPTGGLVPGFWKDANASYGNKEQASDLQDADLMNPSFLTQGPGLSTLTNGTQAGAVTTLVRGMMPISIDGTNIYGGGGAKLHKITSSAVTNAGDWPHTVDKSAVTGEDIWDVAYYAGAYWYSFSHSGSQGDIGRFDGASTFDDDYMSTVPTGATSLSGAGPFQLIVAGDNRMYATNGRYIASFDGTTFTSQALDLPAGEVTVGGVFENNRMYVASNNPNSTSVNNIASVYIWDMVSPSWEYQIRVQGRIGALWAENGTVYIWWQEYSSSGLFFGVVDGDRVRPIARFTGSLPAFYQIFKHDGHICWLSSGEVWAFGAVSPELPAKLFQYTNGGYATLGGATNAFGTPMIASNATTNYKIAKLSGYAVSTQWKSINFDVSSVETTSVLDKVVIQTDPLSTGAKCDVTITYNYGGFTDTTSAQIAYDANETTKTRWVILRNASKVENIRIDISWANGSTTNPVKIRKILLRGYFIPNL